MCDLRGPIPTAPPRSSWGSHASTLLNVVVLILLSIVLAKAHFGEAKLGGAPLPGTPPSPLAVWLSLLALVASVGIAAWLLAWGGGRARCLFRIAAHLRLSGAQAKAPEVRGTVVIPLEGAPQSGALGRGRSDAHLRIDSSTAFSRGLDAAHDHLIGVVAPQGATLLKLALFLAVLATCVAPLEQLHRAAVALLLVGAARLPFAVTQVLLMLALSTGADALRVPTLGAPTCGRWHPRCGSTFDHSGRSSQLFTSPLGPPLAASTANSLHASASLGSLMSEYLMAHNHHLQARRSLRRLDRRQRGPGRPSTPPPRRSQRVGAGWGAEPVGNGWAGSPTPSAWGATRVGSGWDRSVDAATSPPVQADMPAPPYLPPSPAPPAPVAPAKPAPPKQTYGCMARIGRKRARTGAAGPPSGGDLRVPIRGAVRTPNLVLGRATAVAPTVAPAAATAASTALRVDEVTISLTATQPGPEVDRSVSGAGASGARRPGNVNYLPVERDQPVTTSLPGSPSPISPRPLVLPPSPAPEPTVLPLWRRAYPRSHAALPPSRWGSCRLNPGRLHRTPSVLPWRRQGVSRLFLVDSGCTWHCHNVLEDLINTRRVNEIIDDANGKELRIDTIGDLPIRVRDENGAEHRMLVTDVRFTPDFVDSLLSVDQLFESSQIEAKFGSERVIEVPSGDGVIRLPMQRDQCLFGLTVQPLAQSLREASLDSTSTAHQPRRGQGSARAAFEKRAAGSGIHKPNSTSHIAALPADEAAALMHRRLHLGADVIRRLPEMTRDAPAVLSKSSKDLPCAHCVEANATRSGHRLPAYSPSHAGRLVHMDIAGPFRSSAFGRFQYVLVLVDDHTRHKFVYFLKTKNEAHARMRRFIAEFNAKASSTSPTPVRVAGSIHCDNAGEFLSREFTEILDEASVARTTCPPHVHELNGVAERAIRSIFSVVRSNLVASGAPVGFWPHAVQHAVDCLNRTTGPPGSDRTAYELLTGGESPRIMHILPWGCEAFAVKPRCDYRKTEIEAHAYHGKNLGRSATVKGAYDIYVDQHQKIVTTSECYFRENLMPWRARGDRHVGEAPPLAAPAEHDHPPGVPPTGASDELADEGEAAGAVAAPPPAGVVAAPPPAGTALWLPDRGLNPELALATSPPTDATAAAAYAALTGSGAGARAVASRRVLVLFSGAYQRCDGLATFLRGRGLTVDLIDNDPARGGGTGDDVMNDARFAKLYDDVRAGKYFAVFAAPPCSTFSVARFMPPRDGSDGAPPVRDRDSVSGLDAVPAGHERELRQANKLVFRTVALLHAAASVGSHFVLENPADRGDANVPHLFCEERHGPLWLMPEVRALANKHHARSCTFPLCGFGGDVQKYTTLLYTRGLEQWLHPLDRMRCVHPAGAHKPAGGSHDDRGEWVSRETAAYPPDFNLFLADMLSAAAGAVQSPGGDPTSAEDEAEPNPAGDDEVEEDLLADEAAAVRGKIATSPATGPGAPAAPAASRTVPVAHSQRSIFSGVEPRKLAWGAPDATLPPRPLPPVRLPAVQESSPVGVSVDSPAAAGIPLQVSAPDAQFDRLPARFRGDAGGGRVRGPATRSRVAGRGEPVLAGRDNVTGGAPVWGSARHATVSNLARLSQCLPLQWGSSRLAAESESASAVVEPRNHKDAVRLDAASADDAPKWTGEGSAERTEWENHLNQNSFKLTDRTSVPYGRRLVNFTWAYKVKRSGKLKARLCVQGCTQIPGVDYDQTFCAAMRQSSLRLLSSTAARLNLAMSRWDFVSAYLQGELQPDEVVYCRTPPGVAPVLGRDGLEQVYTVLKPIYGMAQAGRRWQRTIFPYLLDKRHSWQLTQLSSDNCVFMCRRAVDTPTGKRNEILIVGVYVDDLFILSSHRDEHSLYEQFTSDLARDWDVEDEGVVNDLLSVQISREPDGHVLLKQSAYIDKLCALHLPDGVPSRSQKSKTPCDDSIIQQVADAQSAREAGETPDPAVLAKYQALVGALLYCAVNTRPDVAYATGMLCRCMACPSVQLLTTAEHVLAYLHHHKHIGLRYSPVDTDSMTGYSDSDWSVRRSTSGAVFMYGKAAISWGSTKQSSVALSSCEAEIMAASEASKDALYLQEFLRELGLASADSIASLAVDNTAAIDLAYNPQHHKRVKHIERRHFFVRECVEEMKLTVPYVRSTENLADLFTKPLPSRQFFALRNLVMNVSPES